MAYQNKVKSSPTTIVDQAIGLKNVNIGVNTNRTYGGSPYTGWYNTFDIPTTAPESIVMYKANTPAEGTISPDGIWSHDFSGDLIPLVLEKAFTIECWVLFPSTVFGWYITQINTSGGTFIFAIDGSGRPTFSFNGSTIVTSSTSIVAGNWAHVALTREKTGKFVYLYLNGVQVGTANFGVAPITPSPSDVLFFKGSDAGSVRVTNLRVVTQTEIYPTESLVGTYPQYPLNRSYDDTAVLILGKKESNFEKDYSVNNAVFEFEGTPYLDIEYSTPLLKIIDATKVSVSPWSINNITQGFIELINGHPSRFGQPYFVGIDAAVEWAFELSTDPFIFSNIAYEETDGGIPYLRRCKMFLDSGNISSYPIVREKHYNLREYNTYGDIDSTIAEYNEQYGGRLWSRKASSPKNPLVYQPSSLYNASSFIYYGVIGFAATFTSGHDIVGFYGGSHRWRVARVSATQARLYVTNGSSTEITLGAFDITGTEYPNPYFGLLVNYDNSTGDFNVYVNGLGVLSGTNPLSRPSGAGGSEFVFGYQSNTPMYHYTSAVWTEGNEYVGGIVASMGIALSSRYTGIV